MMRFLRKKKLVSAAVAGFLTVSLLATPVSLSTLRPQKAEAQFAVIDITNYIANYGSWIADAASEAYNAVSSFAANYLQIKESTLDSIAWQLVNAVIKEMIKSTTDWVNHGFKGNPTFVQDINKFTRDVADQAVGNFIWKSDDLQFLCSPFALDVKIALDTQYRDTRNYQAQCTLTDVVKNVDGFLNGDFLAGGWDGWFQMTQTPSNNPYGALLETSGVLQAKVAGNQDRQLALLSFGNGFMSMKDPTCKPSPDNPDGFDESACPIVTPGTVIEDQLNNVLHKPGERLVVADEVNELLSALFSQLVSNVFSSAGGLAGLNDSGSGSYFDRLDHETDPTVPDQGSLSVFDNPIKEETEYRDLVRQEISMLLDAQTYKDRTYGDGNSCHSEDIPDDLIEALATARTALSVSESAIGRLNEFRSDFLLLQSSTTPQTALDLLYAKYNANSTPDAKTTLMSRFIAYQSSGALHSPSDTVTLRIGTIRSLADEIAGLKDDIDHDCDGRTPTPGATTQYSLTPADGNKSVAANGSEVTAFLVNVPSGTKRTTLTLAKTGATPSGVSYAAWPSDTAGGDAFAPFVSWPSAGGTYTLCRNASATDTSCIATSTPSSFFFNVRPTDMTSYTIRVNLSN
ncbi:MAG TPA: hypothetical protein VFS75_01640 [Candidatus Paceibacterota bacterium]|nr:hypothetical protein [Candidatus Paceibacterota bacterium]